MQGKQRKMQDETVIPRQKRVPDETSTSRQKRVPDVTGIPGQISMQDITAISGQRSIHDETGIQKQKLSRKKPGMNRLMTRMRNVRQNTMNSAGRNGSFGGSVRVKLGSKAGESLTETLVAVLIVSLASILLVTMVQASRRVVTRSGSAYSGYIKEHNELAVEDSSQNSPTEITLTPARAGNDNSLRKIHEKVYVQTDKEGNAVFFPADS